MDSLNIERALNIFKNMINSEFAEPDEETAKLQFKIFDQIRDVEHELTGMPILVMDVELARRFRIMIESENIFAKACAQLSNACTAFFEF